jgi:hypothetical protein
MQARSVAACVVVVGMHTSDWPLLCRLPLAHSWSLEMMSPCGGRWAVPQQALEGFKYMSSCVLGGWWTPQSPSWVSTVIMGKH